MGSEGGGKGIFQPAGQAGWWGAPDGQRWGVKSSFVRVEGSKHQVRHNTGVWALDTAWLCVDVEGGAQLIEGMGGGCPDSAPFFTSTQ